MSQSVNLQNLVTAIATDVKSVMLLINSNSPSGLSGLSTTAKTTLVAAINEVYAAVQSVPSAGSITSQINAGIAAVVGAAPAALDTLVELATAHEGVLTAIANRVRFDAAQTLTTGEKNQACDNIGAAKASDVGDTNVDLVALYVAGRG